MPAITRRHLQRAQHGDGSQGITGLYHGRIHIAPTGNAAAQPTSETIMAFNPAGYRVALNQPRQRRRGYRAAIAPRCIAATGLTTHRRRYAGKPNDAIPKTERFAIKNTDLRGLGRQRPICGG